MSQTQAIKKHLLAHNSITPREALRRYRSFRLAARIKELRNEGMSILTVMCEWRGARYAKYVMG